MKMNKKEKDIRKAQRKGNREAFLEIPLGYIFLDRPHKNKKKYNRKIKHKNNESF